MSEHIPVFHSPVKIQVATGQLLGDHSFYRTITTNRKLDPENMPATIDGIIEPSDVSVGLEDIILLTCTEPKRGKMWFNGNRHGYTFFTTDPDKLTFAAETMTLERRTASA